MMYMSKTHIDDLLTDSVLCNNIAKIDEPLRGIINGMLNMLRVPAAELDKDPISLNILRVMITSIKVIEGVISVDDALYHRTITVAYESPDKTYAENKLILDIVTNTYAEPKLSREDLLAMCGETLARFLNYFSYICELEKTRGIEIKLNSTKTIELMKATHG